MSSVSCWLLGGLRSFLCGCTSVTCGNPICSSDLAEDERKERYKNRHIAYHNLHVQDVRQDHINEERRINKVSIDRHRHIEKRGYDILTNEVGKGHSRGRIAALG